MATRSLKLTPFGILLVCAGFVLGSLFGSLVPYRHFAGMDRSLAGMRVAMERPPSDRASVLFLLEQSREDQLRIQRLEKIVGQLR